MCIYVTEPGKINRTDKAIKIHFNARVYNYVAMYTCALSWHTEYMYMHD